MIKTRFPQLVYPSTQTEMTPQLIRFVNKSVFGPRSFVLFGMNLVLERPNRVKVTEGACYANGVLTILTQPTYLTIDPNKNYTFYHYQPEIDHDPLAEALIVGVEDGETVSLSGTLTPLGRYRNGKIEIDNRSVDPYIVVITSLDVPGEQPGSCAIYIDPSLGIAQIVRWDGYRWQSLGTTTVDLSSWSWSRIDW